MALSPHEALQALLDSQKSYEISIVKISEPISSAINAKAGPRSSDVSADVYEIPSPASLEADLAHYKVISSCYLDSVALSNCLRNYSQNYGFHI